jgi:hypothetical protein
MRAQSKIAAEKEMPELRLAEIVPKKNDLPFFKDNEGSKIASLIRKQIKSKSGGKIKLPKEFVGKLADEIVGFCKKAGVDTEKKTGELSDKLISMLDRGLELRQLEAIVPLFVACSDTVATLFNISGKYGNLALEMIAELGVDPSNIGQMTPRDNASGSHGSRVIDTGLSGFFRYLALLEEKGDPAQAKKILDLAKWHGVEMARIIISVSDFHTLNLVSRNVKSMLDEDHKNDKIWKLMKIIPEACELFDSYPEEMARIFEESPNNGNEVLLFLGKYGKENSFKEMLQLVRDGEIEPRHACVAVLALSPRLEPIAASP